MSDSPESSKDNPPEESEISEADYNISDPVPASDATSSSEEKNTEGSPDTEADKAVDPAKGIDEKPDVTSPPSHSPGLRSLVHFGALAVAFPLTYLASQEPMWIHRTYAAGVCLAGVIFNFFILPRLRIGQIIRRTDETKVSGIWLYPLGLGFAFMLYPAFAVGIAWAAMAAGDAAAVTIGRRMPTPKLPWNEDKGWAGLVAFAVAAIPFCFLLSWWCPGPFLTANSPINLPALWTLAVLAGVSGALLESLKGPFDDNLRLSLCLGLIVWFGALLLQFSTDAMPPNRALPAEWLLHAVLANAVLVGLIILLKFADLSGAIAGGVAGVTIYYFALPQGYVLLILFVIFGSLASRYGLERKIKRGVAESRKGKRNIANAAANLAIPTLCCVAYPVFKGHPAALLAMVGALSAAFADTASSEIGSLAGGKPRLITSGKEVAHGTNGAVTLIGYFAAFGAALLMALAAWGSGFWSVIETGHLNWHSPVTPDRLLLFGFITISAGLLGTTVDSLLGAHVEDKVPGVGKGAVNFLCTLSGAAFAGGLGVLLWP